MYSNYPLTQKDFYFLQELPVKPTAKRF
ncbi:hypothetical protein BDFB_001140 [Asbolus verrucosus]|uniref:Uncharacterized protein n=1 Tax=Asbolus verrucosus TaxID=1661398 RepID=A0A482VQI9_ASBVE|nr:hypothetical protein BDFB_001140 [Asbolus verrucosus]